MDISAIALGAAITLSGTTPSKLRWCLAAWRRRPSVRKAPRQRWSANPGA